MRAAARKALEGEERLDAAHQRSHAHDSDHAVQNGKLAAQRPGAQRCDDYVRSSSGGAEENTADKYKYMVNGIIGLSYLLLLVRM